jgi:hypothetical protein
LAGAGTYTVGLTGTYPTLQAALDQLFIDQSTTAFTATQTILIYPRETTQGLVYTYKGARVPSGLNPTDQFRLVIRSAIPIYQTSSSGGGVPKLYGKSGVSTFDWAGIYVDQVDYVDILDLRIEEFSSGIIFYRSNYGRVISCDTNKNSLFGVQFFESDRGAIVNTVLQNSSMLCSIMRSREIVLIHNTFNTGDPGYRHCLGPQWEEGQIGSSTPLDQSIPIYYAYNNTFHCSSGGGVPLIMPLDIQKTLNRMDGNTYFSVAGAIADIYYTVEGNRVDTFITSLVEWRRITGAEDNSIWDPAGYFSGDREQTHLAGVIHEDSSGIFNRGLSLGVVKSNLPSWFDDSILNDDAGGNPRDDTATPTPGPTEITTGDDYDIFADFLGATSDPTVEDDSKIYGVDRAVSQLQLGLECWSPQVAAGYFYVGDAAYYLYADKFATYLHDVTWSKVELPNHMTVRSVGILNTSECDDATPVAWMQRGNTVWANHSGATISKPIAESVRVYGVEQSWDSSEQAFNATPLTREFSVKDSPFVFLLTTVPQGGAPLVITDDTIGTDTSNRNDQELLPLEYRYEWDASLEIPKLKLQGASNLFENPHFHNYESHTPSGGYAPIGWDFGLVKPTVAHDHQVIGNTRVSLFATSEYNTELSYAFRQTVVRRDEDADLIISWFMRSDSGIDIKPIITTYYENGEVFQQQVLDTIDVSAETSGDFTWNRYAVHCKADNDSTLKEFGLSCEQILEADLTTVNNETSPKVRFELRAVSPGTSEFDAFMAFEGDYVPRYAGLPYGDEATLEYDSSDFGVHEIPDLSISPILNPQHTGFLVIGPVPIEDLDTSVLETGHTTLTDTYTPLRLTCIPWARIDGPDKLRHVSSDIFGLVGQGLPREVGFEPSVPEINKIEVFPNPIEIGQGLRKSFHVLATDNNNNPYAHKDVTVSMAEDNDRYTGSLGMKEMGSLSRLGVEVVTKSDPSGSIVSTLIAPEKRLMATSFDTSDLYPSSKVVTYYKPNLDNHANVTLYRANTDEEIAVYGQYTSETLTPVLVDSELKIQLSELPVFASTNLQVNGTSEFDIDLFESLNTDYADNEFHVDYATGAIFYRNNRTGNAKVSYTPLFVWVDTSDPYALQFHGDLVDIITSEMYLQYDAMSNIQVSTGSLSIDVPVVLLNPDA